MTELIVSYIQTGYASGTHKTESSTEEVRLFSEFLDSAPVWADRVLFQQEAFPNGPGGRSVVRFVAEFDRNRHEKKWDRFQTADSGWDVGGPSPE